MSSSVEELQSLALLTERVSHVLRTPLGVSLGVLDDLARGFTLDPGDLSDGTGALGRMLGILDALGEMGRDAADADAEAGAVRLLRRYAESYRRRFPEDANRFDLPADCDAMELVRRDHSPDSLNLLFAGCIFRSRGGSLRAGWRPGGGLVLEPRAEGGPGNPG